MIHKNKEDKRFYVWIRAWLSIIDAIVVIITLGFYHTSFAMKFLAWQLFTVD